MAETERQPRTIEDDPALAHTAEVFHDEDDSCARVVELPGCMTWTERARAVASMIEDAKRA